MRTLAAGVSLFFCLGIAQAQSHAAYKPGQTIKLAVKVEGPDADRAFHIWAQASLQGSARSGQEGFTGFMRSNSGLKIAPDTFEVDFPISNNQAEGTYALSQIQLSLDQNESVVFVYPPDLPSLTLTVKNDKTVQRPKITVTEMPQ